MKLLRIISLTLISLILFQSCKEDCSNINLPVDSLESEYGCENTKYGMEIDLTDDFTVIRTQSDFDNLVSGTCDAVIDFTEYDLVIGKKGLTSGNESIEYELEEDCESGDLYLKVTFTQNATSVAPNLTYHALVPKIGNGATLNLEIEVNY
ncbi:MAG: hypothetical protein ABFR62_09180 [Bacteroidota bacterium]